ncbi:cupredoxin domain-containing protein [Candidatus Raskinella chloraquaticus]
MTQFRRGLRSAGLMTTYSAVLAVSLLVLSLVSQPALAQETVEISISNHRFQPAEVKVPAGKPLVLIVKNLDASAEEFESKVLKIEKVIAGKSEARINVRPLTPGRYKFYGEFHEATAQGVLIVE